MTEGKIPLPEAYLASMKANDARREMVRQWTSYLELEQQEAVEAAPFGHFRTRIPLESLRSFSAEERAKLMASEEAAYARHKPLAQARDEQRRAFSRAGGEEEAFSDHWEAHGKNAHIAAVAAENLERAKRDGSPY
jgi:hypothetical protein